MARKGASITMELRGEARALEALAAVSKDAHYAQLTAMRRTYKKARSLAARDFAARLVGPLKLYKRRVQGFPRKRRRGLAEARLWAGFRWPITYVEHSRVARRLRGQHPGGFTARRPNGTGIGYFTPAGRTLGDEHVISLANHGRDVLPAAAKNALTSVYVPTLKRDYLRRLRRRIR